MLDDGDPTSPSAPGRRAIRNGFLRALSPDGRDALLRHADRVTLQTKEVVQPAGQVPRFVYFPEGGIISFTLGRRTGGDAEFGIIGREGFSCFSAIIPDRTSPVTVRVQVGGYGAHRVDAAVLRDVARRHPDVRDAIFDALFAFMGQMAMTALSNARHPLDARLARWLLMCDDRLDGNTISLTHEFVAMMLGARRPSVTSALRALEAAGGIRARRGAVEIVERPRLLAIAGEAYHPASAPA